MRPPPPRLLKERAKKRGGRKPRLRKKEDNNRVILRAAVFCVPERATSCQWSLVLFYFKVMLHNCFIDTVRHQNICGSPSFLTELHGSYCRVWPQLGGEVAPPAIVDLRSRFRCHRTGRLQSLWSAIIPPGKIASCNTVAWIRTHAEAVAVGDGGGLIPFGTAVPLSFW